MLNFFPSNTYYILHRSWQPSGSLPVAAWCAYGGQ